MTELGIIVVLPILSISFPLSENEYLKKFETCCEQSIKKIDQYKINQLQEFILNIEKKKNIVDLFNIV